MKNICKNLKYGIRIHTKGLNVIVFLIDATIALALIALIIISKYDLTISDAYLATVILTDDAIILYSTGAWHGKNEYNRDPQRPRIKRSMLLFRILGLGATVLLLVFVRGKEALIIRLFLYCICLDTSSTAVNFAVKAAHYKNGKWLAGTNGKMGPANTISSVRIAIALLIPHIYISSSLGDYSNCVASTTLTLAIATDKLDGTVARKTNTVTRAGMALDPIGDKVLFYPNAFAFAILYLGELTSLKSLTAIIVSAAFVLILARDTLVLAWFTIYARKTHEDISATKADKARMVMLCIWLLSTAYALSFSGEFGNIMQKISIYSLVACAVLSVYSVIADFLSLGYKDKF